MNAKDILSSAARTIAIERKGLKALEESLSGQLNEPFLKAVEVFASISGRLIVTGMGKSGHIGSKIAATFASTGTPAFFVHPAEANHGDLGMITANDAIMAMSWSGETTELKGILAYSRRFKIPLVALTSIAGSTLAREADICLILPREEEACPLGLAPTTSAVLQLVVGDALAIALLEARGFSPVDFKTFHPGGQLGANLTQIGDLMHKGEELPLASIDTSMIDAVTVMTEKGFGCIGLINQKGNLAGIITDGDIRRNFDRNMAGMSVSDVMSHNPKVISTSALASTAVSMLNEIKVTALFVTEDDKPVGLIHMHDLLRAGVA
ncbi:MAG: KpsF/GutQ family sugar-phosphate isomerase [Hyphomicrobiales bacterium]|nr:KpsF/GutQ family sugar-phosphate isomerase [Hyphomicrobiales bacterium]